jgi:hypothetical protein
LRAPSATQIRSCNSVTAKGGGAQAPLRTIRETLPRRAPPGSSSAGLSFAQPVRKDAGEASVGSASPLACPVGRTENEYTAPLRGVIPGLRIRRPAYERPWVSQVPCVTPQTHPRRILSQAIFLKRIFALQAIGTYGPLALVIGVAALATYLAIFPPYRR